MFRCLADLSVSCDMHLKTDFLQMVPRLQLLHLKTFRAEVLLMVNASFVSVTDRKKGASNLLKVAKRWGRYI